MPSARPTFANRCAARRHDLVLGLDSKHGRSFCRAPTRGVFSPQVPLRRWRTSQVRGVTNDRRALDRNSLAVRGADDESAVAIRIKKPDAEGHSLPPLPCHQGPTARSLASFRGELIVNPRSPGRRRGTGSLLALAHSGRRVGVSKTRADVRGVAATAHEREALYLGRSRRFARLAPAFDEPVLAHHWRLATDVPGRRQDVSSTSRDAAGHREGWIVRRAARF